MNTRHAAPRLSELTLTVLDFETTGSVPGYPNAPWQAGWIEVRAGAVVAETLDGSWLRIGDRPFSRHAPGRHALLRATLRTAPALNELWPGLAPRLLGRPLVAHNATTERAMLARTFPLHRFGPWLDTLAFARKSWPGLPSYALEDLVARLGLTGAVSKLCPGLEPHDARYDAAAAALMLAHLLAQPGWDALTLEDAARLR